MDAIFGILGRTALRINGAADESWGRPRPRAVLATLLVHAGRPVPVATLVEWVWPEETPPPRNPVQTFHSYATRIRQWLRPVHTPVALVAVNGGYRLDVDPSTIDYYRFRSLMSAARTLHEHGDHEQALRVAQDALLLWRGQPLEEISTERARNWRQRVLTTEWLPANTLVLANELALGRFEQALAHVDELLANHRQDLSLDKARITALRGCARFDEATAHYLATHRALRDSADDQAAEHLRRFYEALPDQHQLAVIRPTGMVVPRQLPRDRNDFVGRASELADLDAIAGRRSAHISAGPIVISGMAGVGKTALAVHWGHRVRHRFPDGDFYVDLHGFSPHAMIASATVVDEFLLALGHPPDAAMTRRARDHHLRRLLTGRRTLVILDNARNTTHVRDLISLLPDSTILITSRQRLTHLSATGARTVSVTPMNDADATALLSQRLADRRDLSPKEYATLTTLCGGLPLVITVLAEHIVNRPPSLLAEHIQRLDQRQLLLDVGNDGDGDGPANPHTLFTPSYRALPFPERRLFRLLGLHPGPDISIAAASACDGRAPAETKHSLGVLVGAHLLEESDILHRYRLHDLLRDFAAYRAEHDETPAARDITETRILDHYLNTAAAAHRVIYPSRLNAPGTPTAPTQTILSSVTDARTWLDQERPNLIAAIRIASAHGHHDHAWRLADTIATYLDKHGHHHDGLHIRELAVTAARHAGEPEAEASSLVDLGIAYLVLGDHTHAQQALDTARQFAETTHNDRGLACTLHHLARLDLACGNALSAIELYRQSLDISQHINDLEGLCWSHCRVGEALRIADQPDTALIHLHQAQWFALRIGDHHAHVRCMAAIGATHHDLGDHTTAEAHCRQALQHAEQLPDLILTAQVCTTLATIHHSQGRQTTAITYAQRAISLCQQTGNTTDEATAHHTLGDLHHTQGDTHHALTHWHRAHDLYRHNGNTRRAHILHQKIANTPTTNITLPHQTTTETSPLKSDPH